MRIAVCVKQVPDTTELKLDPVHNTLIREGVDSILNPLDEFPLETALRLRDATGGSVTAVTMGPPQAGDVLKKAIAMGADHAILASDRKFAGADTWSTSLTLAATLRELGPFDLILCGKQAIDGDTAQVGPGIAAHLGIPQITYVTAVAVREGKLYIDRMLDHGTAHLRCPLPAVLTILKEANEPRLPTLAGCLRSFKLEIESATADRIGLAAEEIGLNGSPTRVARIAVPENNRQTEYFTGASETIAANAVAALAGRGFRAAGK